MRINTHVYRQNESIHRVCVCGNNGFIWFLNAVRDCFWIKWGRCEFHNVIDLGKKELLYSGK